tara:strand:+ start:309 stop:1013 length:705 start_codon:yes stop_codon:yes gene_type:complete
MSEELEFDTFLSISPNNLEIYLYDKKNEINIYGKEHKINNESKKTYFDQINKFLEDNIFEIEKLIGKFIKNINLIIENEKILTFEIGIKKKNHNNIVNSKDIENILTEAKDLIKENHQEFKIIHIIINNFIINDHLSSRLQSNIESDNLCLEIQFILIPNNLVLVINNILERYQITTHKYLCLNYIKKYFLHKEIELSVMANNILSGCNENEVQVVPKSHKKKGFFEKFFQLFS